MGKENFPRLFILKIDDGTSFKPESPKFKQKGVAEGLHSRGINVTENS
jgi:hypothetical protein